MKFSTAAVAVALASVASAQLQDIPTCALSCFVGPLTSDGCSGLTDFECHCQKPELIPSVTPCVQKECPPAEQEKVIATVQKVCKDAGHPIEVPNPNASSSAAPSSTAAATSAASSAATSAASSVVSSVASSASSVVSSISSAVTSAAGTGAVPTPSGNSTLSTSTPSPYTGAASLPTQAAGLLAAAGLALFL
ncbi:CFEM-domain-containing protein [Delitschia confertaspora ATCC 74209]|uniref:CFEM-domain-containing protein n=1 Tax=Delitschia confertaspora ATCC 74209 TaxID=1513339 RepID=A0A9P4JHD4_9PLEO|nr:CFEM-domain-containing protein [Delitschia confertaspora ATCC 74209]